MEIDIQHIVDNERIPTPPEVARNLLKVSQDPDATVGDLTRVIRVDPKLSAKIVGFCNTPLMGIGRKTTDLESAVVILGMRSVTMLALSFSLIKNKGTESRFDFVDFWNRSLAFAISCKKLSRSASINPDESFLLGLLINIGQIGIGSTYASEISEIQKSSSDEQICTQSGATAEFARLHDLDSYLVGGRLLKQWHFPNWMAEFVTAFPTADLSDPKMKVFRSAEQITNLILLQDSSEDEILQARNTLQELLGWDETEFNTNYDVIANEYGEFAKLLDFDIESVHSIANLEIKAKELLIKTSLGMATEIQQISHEREQLKNDSMIDSLTGLNNRRAYDAKVPNFLLAASDRKEPLAIAVVDIDHFKKFNDTYGHAAGDEVLRVVSHRIRDCIRNTDCVFRFGGEEFVFVLCNCTPEQTENIAERVRNAVEDQKVVFENQTLKVTISTGVAWNAPQSETCLDSLFKEADRLLYLAKDQGRNQCAFSFSASPASSQNALGSVFPAASNLPSSSLTTK